MKRFLLFVAAIVALLPFAATAQIVTTTPAILQETSNGVVLTYHAASPLGNGKLAGLPESTQIYAHIGVIMRGSSEWTHVVTPWPASDGSNADYANTPKNHLTRTAPDTYTLNIGDIRSYFGITDPAEQVGRIAVVFRNADASLEGKTAAGGDIFVDVYPEGFAMSFSSDATSTVINEPTEITFSVATTQAADLTIAVDGTAIATAKTATTLSKVYKFTAKGSFKVTASAVHDGKTDTETITVTWPESSVAKPYPGEKPIQGAVRNADGTVTFCLAAPGKQSVILVPSWNDYAVSDDNVMYSFDYNGNRYFWLTVSGLDDDKYYPYYYLVDGTTAVADPYARLVLDCYSDKWLDLAIWPDMPKYPYDQFDNIMLAVYRGDIDSYDWTVKDFDIPDHSQLIVYELLFRDFTGTVGAANANGTVRAAIDKIPYLKALGINAVELMPIMEFNGNNSWGYNTNFYFAPDKAYGSPDDYREFIDECHSQGIAVILDIVFNQSDGLHPWYQMYPVGQNPFYNEVAPHAYSVLNDWNQGGNPLVEQQWTDALRYWMTAYNVDGFRFDLVKGLGDNNSYGGGTDNYNASRIARMKRLHDVIKSVKTDGIHINEDLAQAKEEIELGEAGMLQWANINVASGRLAAGWNEGESGIPSSLGWGAPISAFLSTAQDNRPWGSTVSYAESHDEQRIAYYVDANAKNASVRNNSYRRLGALAAEMLMTPGPKMIWQFGELGDAQNTKSSDGGNNTDPKTVVWNLLDDPSALALHDTYQALCLLRLSNPDLFSESAEFMTAGLDDALSMSRYMTLTAGAKQIAVLLNTSITAQTKTIKAPVADAASMKLVVASPGVDVSVDKSVAGEISAKLPGGSFAVVATSDVSTGIDDVLTAPADDTAVYYNLQGIVVPNPDPGKLYIVRRGAVTTKEIR
ncbi:MAG: hypothetical protein K2K00_10695 [Muribaculaceae bacterium]|nr:hypothetical protein [Muribaculaceae bacterium]